ncbi:GNAT family N-acetyltransferase [Labrenzia sp. PHM005]|uniref:GNAT family N-acetyltransferase n=1 Tax=Labrenzia sp. PHM005 TaxID=2590016 RepID=UPI00143DA38B|nr:GNAT family N-acetyltransferase [Labrenzia sp. PHM005]
MSPLSTNRLTLRQFEIADTEAFAALNADPEVMADLGRPLSRPESDAKLDRYIAAYEQTGFSRYVVENKQGSFLGYTGLMLRNFAPLGLHYDLGWRLNRAAWGQGYVTEAATAVIKSALSHPAVPEILAYTGPDNVRSQNVMRRLKLKRRPELDFSMNLETMTMPWYGFVWSAAANDSLI